jgi:thiamine transport system substrate-binding protein
MKAHILIMIFLLLITGCAKQNGGYDIPDKDLVIYTGEPFMTETIWQDFRYFEARYDCRIVIRNFADPWQALEHLILSGDSTDVDIICGINNALVKEAIDSKIFIPYKSDNLKFIDSKYLYDNTHHFTPYSSGFMGLMYNRRYISAPPRNYGELQDNRWDDSIIMPDPAITAMGRAFLHFTAAQYGVNGFRYLWKGIQKNIIAFPATYEEAYNRFLAGEGQIIPAYVSLPLFHKLQGDNDYEAVVLEEGSFRVTEFAGIIASSDKMVIAQRFVDYLLTKEFQQKIALQKFINPLNREVAAAAEFAEVKSVAEDNIHRLSLQKVRNEEHIWIRKFEETLGR